MTTMPAVHVVAVAALVSAVLASPAAAQGLTYADVAPRLKAGTAVRLVIDGARVDGEVERATPDGLVIRRGRPSQPYEVPLARLEQVSYDDGNVNGGAIGAAVGAVPGALAGMMIRMLCENEAGSCDSAPFIMGGFTAAIGLAVGVGIDELIRTTVRVGPPRATAAISFVPDPRRPAATLSVRF